MNILFRVDASVRMGHGHVMRCLSLAERLRQRGGDVWFACRDCLGHAGSEIQQHGYEVLWIDAGREQAGESLAASEQCFAIPVEQDAAICQVLIRKMEIDWLIVDHYGIDAAWHMALRKSVDRIMVIDDLADRGYDCDLLLDQTYGRRKEDYVDQVPAECELLLGSEYALLRPEFARLRFDALRQRNSRQGIARVLVSMGGSDPDNMSSRVLQGLNRVDWVNPPRIDLILGPGFQHGDELRRLAQDHVSDINIVENVSNMAEYMQNADLAIGAGGVTSWERCCLGLPALTLQAAENQSLVISNLLAAGAIMKLEAGDGLSESVAKTVSECLQQRGKLDAMSLAAAKITRGLGAELVAARIIPKHAKDGSEVALRPAEASDMEMIHAWQNDENTRRFSHNRQVPTLQEHRRWYLAKLDDPKSYFFIMMHGGSDAGVLRLDPLESERLQLRISIYTAPRHYRQGLARCALEYAISLFSHVDLVAEVLQENTASQGLFSSVGFKQIAKERYLFAATNQG